MKNDLVIPIYLDIQALLDLLASIEDGFRMVETTTTRVTDSKNTGVSGEGGFGITNILSIFKVDLKASGKIETGNEGEEIKQGERYHTYGSLMNQLRKSIIEMGLLKHIEDEESWNELEGSEFIEMKGKFVPNPLSYNLSTFKRLFDIAEIGMDLPTNQEVFDGLNKNQRKRKEKEIKEEQKKSKKESETYKGLIENILTDIDSENFQTYIIEVDGFKGYKIVADLFKEYIRDRSGTELIYGEFKILGKVVRRIKNDESFNLLRGSALGLNEEFILEIGNSLISLEEQGFEIQNTFTRVEAPAIQVIPIAIYI